MIKQEQHKRFIRLNDTLSLLRCFWHAPVQERIAPMGKEQDNDHQRLENFIHT